MPVERSSRSARSRLNGRDNNVGAVFEVLIVSLSPRLQFSRTVYILPLKPACVTIPVKRYHFPFSLLHALQDYVTFDFRSDRDARGELPHRLGTHRSKWITRVAGSGRALPVSQNSTSSMQRFSDEFSFRLSHTDT